MISKNKISFFGLIETKHKRSFSRTIKRFWGYDDFGFCESFASDTNAGGIVTIWDANMFNVTNKFIGERWIILEVTLVSIGFDCCVGVIYGPNNSIDRVSFFEDLKSLLVTINRPILLLGDFNVILNPWERIGLTRSVRRMRLFATWSKTWV